MRHRSLAAFDLSAAPSLPETFGFVLCSRALSLKSPASSLSWELIDRGRNTLIFPANIHQFTLTYLTFLNEWNSAAVWRQQCISVRNALHINFSLFFPHKKGGFHARQLIIQYHAQQIFILSTLLLGFAQSPECCKKKAHKPQILQLWWARTDFHCWKIYDRAIYRHSLRFNDTVTWQ